MEENVNAGNIFSTFEIQSSARIFFTENGKTMPELIQILKYAKIIQKIFETNSSF